MAQAAGDTPIVDGSGLKNSIERRTVEWLAERGVVDFADARTLVVSAVDRFGMADAVAAQGGEVIFGDLIFGLGLPIPLRTQRALHGVCHALLPIVTQLPQTWFYPTGKKQKTITPKFPRYYEWADIICGDFQYIRRHLAPNLTGKTIITNTTKPGDLDLLRERGVARLVTSTPDLTLGGRSPGTNVLEALVVALLERDPADLTAADYMETLDHMGWEPRVVDLG
ncbi:MAG: quinate 5-dehydrogenase [Armatimonadia bacterium]|nr:quinate 5-dehydrogenase [Armatimonadia bacterium]